MTTPPVNVVCMKWGSKYGPHYVNILRAMVRRHLSRPHRFVCLTDDRRGVHPDIECFDLPEGLPEALRPMRGEHRGDVPRSMPSLPERGWLKISLFRPTIGNLTGTTLYLDLDVVIIDDIDPLIDHPGRFCISHDWTWRGMRPETGNSSVMRFEIGAHREVYETFVGNWRSIVAQHRNDQWFVSAMMRERTFWPLPWCVSFKRHCVPPAPLQLIREPSPPEGARIVIFHGRPDPPDAAAGRSGKWHRCLRPAPWILHHWRDDPTPAADETPR